MLVEHLDVLAQITGVVCRRDALRGADAEDFAAWVRLRLVENEYAILARFRGECALRTYLTTVVATLHRDYRVHRDGRWRPSAAALHAGPLAVRLERLVYRNRLPFEQAVEVLQTEEVPPPTRRALAALFRALRARTPLRPVTADATLLEHASGTLDADAHVTGGEDAARRRAVEGALARTVDSLPPEDRVILRMRFWEGASVADVARALGLPQKPLYRRLERLLAALRGALEAAGVDRLAVGELLGGDAPGAMTDKEEFGREAGDSETARPSNLQTPGARRGP